MNEKTNCHCQKCGFSWYSLKLATKGVPPTECASCKSYTWNQPRKTTRRRR